MLFRFDKILSGLHKGMYGQKEGFVCIPVVFTVNLLKYIVPNVCLGLMILSHLHAGQG